MKYSMKYISIAPVALFLCSCSGPPSMESRPLASPIAGASSISCAGIVGTSIAPKDWQSDASNPVYFSEIAPSTDVVAISIAGQEMKLQTTVSVQMGSTESSTYVVESNNEKSIIATRHATAQGIIESVVINKETGHATWQKTYASWMGKPMPYTRTLLMSCN